MKKNFLIVLTCLTTLVASNSNAQTFTGKIDYQLEYEAKGSEELGMMAMMLPTKETLIISGDKAKVMQESTLSKYIFIKDVGNDTTLVYIEIMGQKFQLLLSQAQIKKQFTFLTPNNIEYTSGKKLINKQVCKRALINYGDSLPPCEVYYMPDVKNSAYPMFGDLNGLPVSFTLDQDDFFLNKTAITITKQVISDSEFQPLIGYTPKTAEELQTMFQGFGGN
jgi:hypothetical protein